MKKNIVFILIICGIKVYNDIPNVSVLMYHDIFYKEEMP